MRHSRLHFRLFIVAVAAMAGTLFSAREVAACSRETGSKATGGCCSGRVGSACCCEPANGKSQSTTVVFMTGIRSDFASEFAPLREPDCECRSGEPNGPATKSDPPSLERRSGNNGAISAELNPEIQTKFASARQVDATESPPSAPIFLRTSRLLI
jgi:hypothetical protein